MFGLIGLWFVMCDEVFDLQCFDLWFEIDGYCYQNGNMCMMVFIVVQLIVYLLICMMLQLGDVIMIGMLLGVGMGIKLLLVFLKVGQMVCFGIDGFGEQLQSMCYV